MNQPTPKPEAGKVLPVFSAKDLAGNPINIGEPLGRWMLLIVYRGKHCGRCKMYLNNLESMQQKWSDAGFDILAVSADPAIKVEQDIAEFGWTFPIACELQEEDMHRLGLYVSDPLTPDETDRRFAEPGVFCLRPDGTVQIAAISNGPSARPDLEALLDGMIFTIEHDKPARGTAV